MSAGWMRDGGYESDLRKCALGKVFVGVISEIGG